GPGRRYRPTCFERSTRSTATTSAPMRSTRDSMLLCGARVNVDHVLAHFAEHGYARLGRLMSDAALGLLRRRADDLMLAKVTYPGLFFQLDTETGSYDDLRFGRDFESPSLNYRKIEKLEKDDLFLAWLQNPLFQTLTNALLGEHIVIYRAVLMNKPKT